MKKLVMVGAIAGLLATVAIADETVLDMPLNNANETKDKSAQKNNGTKIGKALVKDGSLQLDGKKSYLSCGKKESLELGKDDITIVVKFKLAPKQPERSCLVSKGAGSDVDAGYAFMYRLPKKCFYFYASNGKKRAGFQSNNDDLNDGKWHTAAVTLSRGVEVIFALDGKVRGVRKENIIPADNISSPARELLIGSWNGGHCLNGSIKDVKIIKKAYTAKELAALTK